MVGVISPAGERSAVIPRTVPVAGDGHDVALKRAATAHALQERGEEGAWLGGLARPAGNPHRPARDQGRRHERPRIADRSGSTRIESK